MTDTKTAPAPITILVPLEVKESIFTDLLCCAFEGGIGYWARLEDEEGEGTYLHDMVMSENGYVVLGDSTGEGFPESGPGLVTGDDEISLGDLRVEAVDRIYMITRGLAIAGLTVMAQKYPKHFANALSECGMDGETGDVFVQCALFGDVVFG